MKNRRIESTWRIYLQQTAGILVRFVAVWVFLIYLVLAGIFGAWVAFAFLSLP